MSITRDVLAATAGNVVDLRDYRRVPAGVDRCPVCDGKGWSFYVALNARADCGVCEGTGRTVRREVRRVSEWNGA